MAKKIINQTLYQYDNRSREPYNPLLSTNKQPGHQCDHQDPDVYHDASSVLPPGRRLHNSSLKDNPDDNVTPPGNRDKVFRAASCAVAAPSSTNQLG